MSEINTARQFWIQAPGHGEIVTASLPHRQPNEVQVRTLFSGISRGTESLVFGGQVPPSQYQPMRAPFQEGDFPGPVKYGYNSVGEVQTDRHTPANLAGQTVFCLYPHQDRYWIDPDALTPVPSDVPASRAVLAANMETAVNAVWDAQPAVGDYIVVVGAGVVGLLISWLCRQLPGAKVVAVDVNPTRKKVAAELGIQLVTAVPTDTEADLVIHASGQPEGLRDALVVAGHEATIVDVSWYGNQSVSLPLGEAFHSRRLTLKSSQVGRLNPNQTPRWNRARRMALAMELLRDGHLDALITGESPFEELPEVMARLSQDPGTTLCHRICY